jgi:hypothetical protein
VRHLENRWITDPHFAAHDCDLRGQEHDQRMGDRARSSTPDLFSSASIRKALSPSTGASEPTAIPARHVLPADLPKAVRHLNDHEFDQLLSAVLAEQERRGKKLAAVSPKQGVEVAVAVPLTQGKLNAVRAAFKAGVTPSRIARQFGISQADVRKALASVSANR